MYLIICVLLIVFLIFALQKWHKNIRQRIFAYFMSVFTKEKNPKYEVLKKELFKTIPSTVSHIPELRKKNTVKILEIGVGTGTNFEYYPDGTNLVVIDPNPHFKSYYDKNRAKHANISSEEIIVTTGENMHMVESNSVDIVVMTLVMCSVDNIPKMLQEILRVLAPSGKFYFFEHIREFKPEINRFRQILHDILSMSRIWPCLFDGCCLDRDMLDQIEATGFSSVKGERIYAPNLGAITWMIQPHLLGTAFK